MPEQRAGAAPWDARLSSPGSPVCVPDWLALREDADAAARAPELVDVLRASLGTRARPVLVRDLGCGTGQIAEALAGLEEPTLLAPDAQDAPPALPVEHRAELDAAPLTALARDAGVTLARLVETAWAVVLGRLTGRQDVVLGRTVAGRDPEVPGVERMVGLLINTVPVRVRLRAAEPVADLLARTQREQALAPRSAGDRATDFYDDYLDSYAEEPAPAVPPVPGKERVANWARNNAVPANNPGLGRSRSMAPPSTYAPSSSGTLRRKTTRRTARPARSTYYEEEEEGYASGDYDDGPFEMTKIRVKVRVSVCSWQRWG